MEKEEWKDISGYEGLYQVSNFGRVKSLERKVINGSVSKRLSKEKFLKLSKITNGYLQVNLSKQNRVEKKLVHRLVMETFCPRDDMLLKYNGVYLVQVDHINYNKEDNALSNLQWLSCKENIRKSVDKREFKKKILNCLDKRKE